MTSAYLRVSSWNKNKTIVGVDLKSSNHRTAVKVVWDACNGYDSIVWCYAIRYISGSNWKFFVKQKELNAVLMSNLQHKHLTNNCQRH